jgi:hypothetical protein
VAAKFEGRAAAGAGVGVGVDVCLTAAEASVDVRGVVAVVVDVVVLGFTAGVCTGKGCPIGVSYRI